MNIRRHAGYSLIELAIVITIIGLIAGGVVVGSSLVRSAQVQSVGSDFQKYEQAVINFKNTYFALPGDMSTATAQWGVLAGTGSDAACQNTESTTTATCNGNDNGFIETSAVADDERFRAWQHLANADMISGTYTGTTGTVGSFVTTTNNSPVSRVEGSVYRFNPTDTICSPCGQFFNKQIGNYIEFRAITNAPNLPLTPAEAYNIDLKFDDERPSTGRIHAPRATSAFPQCTSNDDPATATYLATITDATCVLDFRIRLE